MQTFSWISLEDTNDQWYCHRRENCQIKQYNSINDNCFVLTTMPNRTVSLAPPQRYKRPIVLTTEKNRQKVQEVALALVMKTTILMTRTMKIWPWQNVTLTYFTEHKFHRLWSCRRQSVDFDDRKWIISDFSTPLNWFVQLYQCKVIGPAGNLITVCHALNNFMPLDIFIWTFLNTYLKLILCRTHDVLFRKGSLRTGEG